MLNLKKILITLLVILTLGCKVNAQSVLKIKENPVVDIINKNHPGGYPKGDLIYEVLNLSFYWGETLESVQKRIPSLELFSINDNGTRQYTASTKLHEGVKTIELISEYSFIDNRLYGTSYNTVIYNTTETDSFSKSIIEAYLKMLKTVYGNKPTIKSYDNIFSTATDYIWLTEEQNKGNALLGFTYNNTVKCHSIEIMLSDPTFIVE